MNAANRLDLLISTPSNGISQENSIQPDLYPSAVSTSVPLPPRRDSSAIKSHRQRHQNDQPDQEKQYQPLLNSSTLDDLFRALTLECEQYLAASSSYQNKTYGQIIVQPSSNKQTAVDSNDDDYENLHSSPSSKPMTSILSPLKTSIEVLSPIKRHVVSITISSKISSIQSPVKPSCVSKALVLAPAICHSSEEDPDNISSSSTNRKRRRRARKQVVSLTATRSSSSSNERKEVSVDKKAITSKRSFSTDPRYQRHKTPYDNNLTSLSSSQKQQPRRPRRRDISLQHYLPNSGRFRENHASPLSVLLTSTKGTSDFLDHSHPRQQRRSRLETIDHRPSTLLDRMHRQLSIRNNKTNNIPTHRMPSYPVY